MTAVTKVASENGAAETTTLLVFVQFDHFEFDLFATEVEVSFTGRTSTKEPGRMRGCC